MSTGHGGHGDFSASLVAISFRMDPFIQNIERKMAEFFCRNLGAFMLQNCY